MASPTISRRLGLSGGTAIKAPVLVATTANITLYGEQSIDGVTTSASDVLVKNQTDTTQNGIYTSDSATWSRRIDADGTYDLVQGTLVYVNSGSTNSGLVYQQTAATPVIGTSAITWTLGLFSSSSGQSFTAAGTGAMSRSSQSKMRDVVNVLDYGADPTGVSDATTAFNNAIAALPNGGEIEVIGTFLINGTVTLQNNITLKGIFGSAPIYVAGGSSTLPSPYNVAPTSTLKMGTSGTISLGFSCTLDGLILFSSLSYNNGSTLTFTGTAITVPGNSGVAVNDACVRNCGIFGFNTAISATYANRLRCVDLNIDCLNGISLATTGDSCYFERVKLWSFLNYYRIATYALATRAGTAFSISGSAAWHQVINCAAVGWATGVNDSNCGTNVYRGCQFDLYGAGARNTGTVAFNINGSMTGSATLIEDCQSTMDNLFTVNVTGSSNVFPAVVIDNFVGWAGNAAGTTIFNITAGYVHAHRLFAESYNSIGTLAASTLSNYESVLGANGTAVIGIGGLALSNAGNSATNLVAIGFGALQACSSGSNSVAIGSNALNVASTATQNVAVGVSALLAVTGSNNTALGYLAGSNLSTGSGGVYIGEGTQAGSTGAVSEIVVGSGITGKGSNTAFIGGSSGAYNGANASTWSTTSDERIKENINPLVSCLAAICALRPVSFTYKIGKTSDVGFIAQEYTKVFPEQIRKRIASPDELDLAPEGELLVIQQNLVPYLVMAIQELYERLLKLEKPDDAVGQPVQK